MYETAYNYNVEGDRNKGRICIDDIVFSFEQGSTFAITAYSAIVEKI